MSRALRLCVLAAAATVVVAPPRRVAADDAAPTDAPSVFDLMGDLEREKLLWRKEWMADDAGGKTSAAETALRIATTKDLDRKVLRKQFAAVSKERRAVGVNNLDVGRHQLTKWILAQAMSDANARLRSQGLQTIERTTTVNSGGTGDFTRDVDVTVFAGDEVRERTFFECVRDLARKEGLTVETGPGDTVKSGINLPEIEVAFHRGNNDLPDPRYATDVQQFALDYRKAIEGQSRNPEAYFGYGFEMEVQGRRYLSFKPGTTLLQTFDADGSGVKYRAQIASCNREVRAVIRGAVGQRYRRAQHCVHAVNDYLQAFRHEMHEGGDPTKGALKYAGRAIESLCEYHGFRNWSELVREDRVQLLARLFPPGYLETPGARRRLEYMAEGVDYAYAVFQGKSAPKSFAGKPMRPEGTAKLCLLFLRKASASMVGAVAQEMLDPPEPSARFLDEVNRHDARWQDMSPAERDAFARQRDETYRQCVSVAAMENLLATVEQLRVLDLPEFDPQGLKSGTQAIREMIDGADPAVRPVLEIAVAHADASARLQSAKSADERNRATADLADARRRMEERTRKPSPGRQTEEAAAAVGATDYVRRRKAGSFPAGTEPPAETKRRADEFSERSLGEAEAAGFRAQIRELGVKGYVSRRLGEELLQAGNIADGLQLIEMAQNGATRRDFAAFAATNVLARCHWGMGFLIQAVQVRTAQDVRELGKNVVFDAFSRVIPGLAQAKVAFDIERGIVMVTFGHAVNQANAALIDALYTGEAGRVNDGAAGKVAGRIRDSGVCVLDARFVVKETEKGVVTVAVDQPALYQSAFTEWFGPSLRYDEISSRSPLAGERGALLAAHDRLARAVLALGTDKEPSWFGRATGIVDPREIDLAADGFVRAIEPLCRARTQRVLDELAPREFFRQGDSTDQIAAGLLQRYVSDVCGGMIATWQTHRVEQMLARREVDVAAKLGDRAALAQALLDPGDTDMPTFDVELLDVPRYGSWFVSGALPLRCRLRSDRPLPARLGNVKVEVEPLPIAVTREATGQMVSVEGKQSVRFRMVANDGAGPVVGERTVEIPVEVHPSAEQVIRRAFGLQCTVFGVGRSTTTGGTSPGDWEGNPEIRAMWIPPDHTPKIAWSGDTFSIDASWEKGAGTLDDLRTHVEMKATGRFDPVANTVSFTARSVETTTQNCERYGSTRVETSQVAASEVPVGSVFSISLAPMSAGADPWNPFVMSDTELRGPKALARMRISGSRTIVTSSWEISGEETKRSTVEEKIEILQPKGASFSFHAPREAFLGGR